jgi:hypothetical protein
MDLAEVEDLPDYMDRADVERVRRQLLDDSVHESLGETLLKLNELAGRQWHTYMEPSIELKRQLESWLRQHWNMRSEFLETCLGLGYCFALSRSLYEAALAQYKGASEDEYRRNRDRSSGEFIDPYWSMRRRGIPDITLDDWLTQAQEGLSE